MFENLTVKARLFCLSALMMLMMAALTAFNLYAMHTTNQNFQSVYLDRAIPIADLSEIKNYLLHNRTALVTGFSFPQEMAGQHKKIEKNITDINKSWDEYLQKSLTPEEKILAEKFTEDKKRFLLDLKQAMAMQSTGHSDAQRFYFETVRASYLPVEKEISELIKLQKNVAQTEYTQAQTRYDTSIFTSIIFISLAIGLSFFVSLIIIRRLMNELGGEPNYAAWAVKEVAQGHLSVKIKLQPNDKSSLLYAIEKMRENLSDIISNTSEVMNQISKGELSTQMTTEVQGDFVLLKDSINQTVSELRVTLFALNDVLHSIYTADFTKVVVANVHGRFKEILEKGIQSQEAIRIMLDDIIQVMGKVAAGDLNHRVTANAQGELLALKNNINSTLNALECLNEIERVSAALANGDLTQSILTNYPGIFGKVTSGINHTADNLKNLIDEIKLTSEVIANAARDISAGNNDLSHRTEEQASSLQQTASSMEELSSAVKQNTDNAKNANSVALDAANTATKGVNVVNDVVETMANINESSHQIVDIITVIDDIAFQTNILALNAAVEAARAGEQGKGFAVVAVEVRNLAQRAASAAGEIKRLINDSVERISSGSKQVEQAGATMNDIVSSIQKVTALVTEIASASIQQNAGIDQIHQAIVQMDSVTQQNAALVEQAAAATESLSDQTKNLAIEMAQFKTSIA